MSIVSVLASIVLGLLADLEQVDDLGPSESGRDASGWGSTGKRGRNG